MDVDTWAGNLGKLDQHLNIGRENGECQFVVIECPISMECKEHFMRKQLLNHKESLCKYRQVQCMYCGFASTYQNITISHANKCTKYPLLCPNHCSNQTYPRDRLKTHLASCPEQEVECTFIEMGCKEKVKRRALQQHLDTNLLQHQVVMCQTIREMKKEKQEVEEQLESFKRDKKELEMKMYNFSIQEDNQIKALKYIAKTNTKLQSIYFSKMEEFTYLHPVVPVVFKASLEIKPAYVGVQKLSIFGGNNVNNHDHLTATPYHSELFYSHQNGYKLQLSAEIMCHCSDCKKAQKKVVQHPSAYPSNPWPWQDDGYQGFGYTQQQALHPSDEADYRQSYHPGGSLSVAVNLYIFKGDHDSQLKWPFKEQVTISMYYEDSRKCLGMADFRRSRKAGGDGKDEYCIIPQEIAVFGGNQNHTSTGSKLGIESLIESNENDLVHLLQPALQVKQTWLEIMIQKQSHKQSDKAQCHGNNTQQQKLHLYMEKGLLFPLYLHRDRTHTQSGWSRNDHFTETVYFEVTISPQITC